MPFSRPTTDLSFDPRNTWFELPDGGPRWAVQVFTAENAYVVDPDRARLTRGTLEAGLARAGRQAAAPGSVRVEVESDGSEWRWRIEAAHPEPVKAVKLLLTGLPAGGCWSPTTGRTEPSGIGRAQWSYPGPEWATPWMCVGEGPAFALSVRDSEVRAKRLHLSTPPYAEQPIVELVHVERAGRRAATLTVPEIRLARCADEAAIEASLAEHLAFLERAYGLRRWDERPDRPAWLERIALVVTLHGQHWTGHVFNGFAQMEEALRVVASELPGERVLAYLPGWEGRYYHAYPIYRPGSELGGDAGFAALVRTAHDLGVRLMPMFGAHGANVANYPDWQRAAMRNDTDRYPTMLNAPDWDGDRAGEGDQVFLNPGEPRFRRHLTDSISTLVRDFGVDAAFLDTAGFWFDDPRHDAIAGYRTLVGELHEAHPELLLASEGWFDALLGLFPLAQQWLDVDRDVRFPELVNRYARTTGHLAEGAPGRGSTGVHEQGFRPRPRANEIAGHIPSVSVVDDTLRDHRRELLAICRRASERAR